jgi:hypothetical protein
VRRFRRGRIVVRRIEMWPASALHVVTGLPVVERARHTVPLLRIEDVLL